MKAQASVEVLMVTVTIIIALSLILYFSSAMISDQRTLSEAKTLVSKISDEANLIYFLGEGASKIFPVYVPENLNDTRTFLLDNVINYGVYTSTGTNDVFEDVGLCTIGNIPKEEGFYYIIVSNLDSCVYIDYYEDSSLIGNPPIVTTASVNQTVAEQYDYICINASVYDTDGDIYKVWAQFETPQGETFNVSLADTGAWCAGEADDNIFGADVALTSFGVYTLLSAYANDLTGNYASHTANIEIYMNEGFQIGEGSVYLNFPDATTKNRQTTHSFLIWNDDTVSVNYFYEVKEVWDHGWSSAEFCTLINPLGADFSCVCEASPRQCNATWDGVFGVSPSNFTIFSYSFDNSGLDDYDMNAYVTFKIINGTEFTKSRTLDFIQNVPTAQIYLSADKNNWAQGIHVPAGQLVTMHIMLAEESGKSPTEITNPSVTITMPKTWTNITAPYGVLSDLGSFWQMQWNFTTISTGGEVYFNFTANSPLSTTLTLLSALLSSSDSGEHVNNTNIHELGIRTVESCTLHTDCSEGRFCNNFMFCEDKKGTGGNCAQSEVYDSLSTSTVCVSNYCRQSVASDDFFCTANSNDCTEQGFSRDNGYVAIVDESSYTCTNGVWVLN